MYRSQQAHDTGGGAEHGGYLSASTITSSFSQTQFPSPLFSVDPRLSSGSQLLTPGTTQHAGITSSPAREPRSSVTTDVVHPLSSISARLTKSPPPLTVAPPTATADAPRKLVERALPARDVTAETISAAYVDFILFCNPNFPLDVDTTTLRTQFRSPPKSGNKEFEIFRLFELIGKLGKEVKTWSQLALDLGVEAPDVAKGQSVQKVQQYSVRLKRWMRAMHIDAFFEYLLGKQHCYFTDIPSASDPYPPGGRDGVIPEEDLAVRALDPSFRPKRGRRRNSDTSHDDSTDGGPASKHSRLEPSSAVPLTAHPDGYHDPWALASAAATSEYNAWLEKTAPRSAVATTAPSHLRWQFHGTSNDPLTPHPMTAVSTSMAAHIDRAFDEEPRSAVTPSRGRKRKHGPAVSSAWPSAMAPGSRPRGRPPSGRTTQDGAFNTFPVESKGAKPGSRTTLMGPPGDVTGTPILPPPIPRPSEGPGRPGRLSLQVPPHTGGPVRLATPPPRVTVNGESNSSDGRSQTQTPIVDTRPPLTGTFPSRPLHPQRSSMNDRDVPAFAFEALKRVLTSDLLRAEVIGRAPRLTSDEAKGLANSILDRLGVPRHEADDTRDDIARFTAASWLGLGEQLNVPLGPATSSGKKVAVTRFRRDADGYEEIVPAGVATAPGETRDVYDLAWTVALGGCQGHFELKGLLIDSSDPHVDPVDHLSGRAFELINSQSFDRGAQDDWLQELHQKAMDVAMTDVHATGHGGPAAADDGVDWKARAMALEFGGRVVQGAMKRLKGRLIEELMDVLQ